jgi:signal transduction histidine kinase
MRAEFWEEALIVIYFFYGLAFYSMGLALLVESGRASELSLARSIRLLAGFGLLHGFHEWLDMLARGLEIHYQKSFPAWLGWLHVSVLATSFLALLIFGESLLKRKRGNYAFAWRLTIGAITWYTVSAIIIQIIYDLDDTEWLTAADVLARYVIGIPGAVLACIALLQQRAAFREGEMARFVQDLTLAAIALGLYGVVGQLFTKESQLFPSTILNSDFFLETFGFPIQLFRALLAALVTYFMIHVLRALEVENRQKLDAIREEQRAVEERSREELTRLNSELQAANEETARLLQEVQSRDARRGVLLKHITAAQEAERRRIARELHDDTGQALTALAMGLRGTISLVEKTKDERVARYLGDLETIANTTLGSLRILINDLRPPQLDDMGLVAAIRWLVGRINERGMVAVTLDVLGDPLPLPQEVETTLFRIIQEGLNNIIKHAQAEHAWVKLDFRDGLTLTVQDDGIGFDPESVFSQDPARKSWGLLGMQERANLINAQLSFASQPNQGATLTIYLDTTSLTSGVEGVA